MPYSSFRLPEYPVRMDVWDRLQKEKRPILLYGMGNGADKLLDRFADRGIVAAGVFASDEFVRGQSYRGFRVMTFSEVRARFPAFVIVLAFASDRPEVLSALLRIDREYDLLAPDMPVAGGEYFDRAYYNAHYEQICAAYRLFADETSRSAFAAVCHYRLTGKISFLLSAYSGEEDLYAPFCDVRGFLDVGAYRGDTLRAAMRYFPRLERVAAIEPDERNFARLAAVAEQIVSPRVDCFPVAAWSENGEADFAVGGNRNSSLFRGSYRHRARRVRLARLDSLGLFRVDLIKYDVEGAEREALIGSEGLIRRDRPGLSVAVYHRSGDLFTVPLWLCEKYEGYRFLLRRALCLPGWEITLLCIPERKIP